MPRQLHLNALLRTDRRHEAAWREAGNDPARSQRLGRDVALARTADRGLLVLFTDTLAARYEGAAEFRQNSPR